MWHERDASRTETQLEAQFDHIFFREVWGYWGTGEQGKEPGYCLNPQYAVAGAGQTGGTGSADLALGWWERDDAPPVPQVLCEFKDIRSGLDAPQQRKGNDRSPVKQCFDYLKYAFDSTDSHSTLIPNWGLVTDMNEFRLYARRVGDSHYQRFFIKSPSGDGVSLLDDGEGPAFQRFLFTRIFQRTMLLAEFGKSGLEKVLEDQWVQEKELEKGFYKEYQSYREAVYQAIIAANPSFEGTRGTLVRLTQRFLDRCIFILFCEDMGKALDFPNDLLRDMLARASTSPDFSPDFTNIWDLVKQLFRAMRDGGPFPPSHTINRFNGGLFEESPELEALCIPNHVFCAKGQGESSETLSIDKRTLLYLSASYNFGAHGADHQRTITLYALGRIFEQSITDLEYMEAEADGKETLATVNKRKRDGVYYTPEWVTNYIIKETVGARLADIRADLGLELGAVLPEADLTNYRSFLTSKRRKKTPDNKATRMMRALDLYEEALNKVKVLDPSCGSGAFLIQALQFLLTERRTIAEERARIAGTASLFDNDANMRAILSNNLYGVDINPESVEITQLALWLNTALPGKPLSNLDTHIRCGNSLVGPDFEDFYNRKHPETLFAGLDEQTRESVNVFDWAEAFPEVLGPGVSEDERGFDCVIGNPPYVKLQNFRKVKQDESDYYIEATDAGDVPVFESAQTGNFDLYLPFIEKGISLLNPKGRMGYIAPSLWLKNEYGVGLRRKMKRVRSLDRWIDFKSFQVFAEATTYTALQFFRGMPNDAVRFFIAPDGDITPVSWTDEVDEMTYNDLPVDTAWNLQEERERLFLNRIFSLCRTLAESTAGITVGIQTSADLIYHLRRVGTGQYCQEGRKGDGITHQIEDEIMHPLVSGPDAQRYQLPSTQTHLLFPYELFEGNMRLIPAKKMKSDFPRAWAYLQFHETALRARERGKMDRDDIWWGYNYPKNLDKQEVAKLGVAETVLGMRVFADSSGAFYFNNVRVNGILPSSPEDLFFLLGVLNSPVVDFVFKRIAKPKGGGYFEANKQYIAPLPIPPATDDEKADVGTLAEKLQTLHTARRDRMALLQHRLDADQCAENTQSEDWLWAEVRTVAAWKEKAPADLSAREKTSWAKERRESYLAMRLEKIEAVLNPDTPLSVEEHAGEVRLLAAGVPLASIVEDESEASFTAAQWRQIARTTNITAKFKAKTLVKALLTLRRTENTALREQVVRLDGEIRSLDSQISEAEAEMNGLVYRLYKLTDEEVKLVEAG